MMTTLESLPWQSLPDVPRITADFFDGQPIARRFLGPPAGDTEALHLVSEKRRAFMRQPDLGSDILASYQDNDVPDAVRRNLDLLDKPVTLAVVTGQQIGLFGGPLYTYYKALTTIILARTLTQRLAAPVVPIFWMETADSDFGEVNRIGFPPDDVYPRRAAYTPRDIVAGRPVRFHSLTYEILPIRDAVLEWMADLPEAEAYAQTLTRAYQPGRLLVDAFRELMNHLFGDSGLVLFDPLAPKIIDRSRSFWDACFKRPDSINNSYTITASELEALRLTLQVRLRDDTLPIHLTDESGIRRRIHGKKDRWWLGASEQEGLDIKGLRALPHRPNEFLSPSVLLRPLLQDWLLPTVIQVAGPAEIAYLAQIGRSYDVLSVPRPLIHPRISVTLVEPKVERLLVKHGWTVAEVLSGRELLLRRAGRTESLNELMGSGREQLNGWLERINKFLDDSDISMGHEMDVTTRKILYQWGKLERLCTKKLLERNKSRALHAEKLLSRLLPDEMLQERQQSPLYYLAAFGDAFRKVLDETLDPFMRQHFIVKLGVATL